MYNGVSFFCRSPQPDQRSQEDLFSRLQDHRPQGEDDAYNRPQDSYRSQDDSYNRPQDYYPQNDQYNRQDDYIVSTDQYCQEDPNRRPREGSYKNRDPYQTQEAPYDRYQDPYSRQPQDYGRPQERPARHPYGPEEGHHSQGSPQHTSQRPGREKNIKIQDSFLSFHVYNYAENDSPTLFNMILGNVLS